MKNRPKPLFPGARDGKSSTNRLICHALSAHETIISFGQSFHSLYAARLSESLFDSRGDMDDITKITSAPRASANWRTPALVIGFGSLIALIAFGPRSTL